MIMKVSVQHQHKLTSLAL